jgi:hypothetical protein
METLRCANDPYWVDFYEKAFREKRISHPFVDAVRALEPGEVWSVPDREITPHISDMLLAAYTVYGWRKYIFGIDWVNKECFIRRPSLTTSE